MIPWLAVPIWDSQEWLLHFLGLRTTLQNQSQSGGEACRSGLSKQLFKLYIYLFIGRVGIQVEIREQLAAVGSLFPTCEFQEFN